MTFLEQEGKVGYRWGRENMELEVFDYPEFITRLTSHIPDNGQAMVSYYGLYANAHQGRIKKAGANLPYVRMIKEKFRLMPSKGWADIIHNKVYEVDPMTCPKCGGLMKVVAFLTDHVVADRIIECLKLTFVAEKPPPGSSLRTMKHLWKALFRIFVDPSVDNYI